MTCSQSNRYLAQSWIPRETVIFASDVRINFDKFRNCMTATVISKTIITTNPGKIYSLNMSWTLSVKDEELCQREKVPWEISNSRKQFQTISDCICALIVCVSFSSICRCVVNEMSNTCTFCGDISSDSKSTFTSFDILVDLSDHTGTLSSCYLSDCVAEETLGCTVHEFLTLTEDKKTALKWHLLLERSKIYFKLTLSPSWRTGLKVNVLSCKLADPTEATFNFGAYKHVTK
uniref:Meiosis specific with OB-fold n=1 Tax=Apteryx owenii TaxID=8824 RepID=A0A8B9PF77_APTOW